MKCEVEYNFQGIFTLAGALMVVLGKYHTKKLDLDFAGTGICFR